MTPRKAIILGAAGRDFHNFNVFFRHNPAYRVVAFTAAQIPYIQCRTYPAALAGTRYPAGIPVFPESKLESLIQRHGVHDVFFSYSDLTHAQVMHLASRALAHGASFHLLGPRDTMLDSARPVVAVVGSRTGCGKSTVTRYVCNALRGKGMRPVMVRHPMPYNALDHASERYRTPQEVLAAPITVEEMEEYQQHVEQGGTVFAGVDYAEILGQAEAEGDLILWDGGNNDMAFYRPDVTVTVLDPLRPGQEDAYHPGEANIRAADILVVNKVNEAAPDVVEQTLATARRINPGAALITMESGATVDKPELIKGKRVLVVEDAPSVTHGGLSEAAGAVMARRHGAEPVDPRGYALGSLRDAYLNFPHLGPVLPSLGYSAEQREELRLTIENTQCDAVLLGTPADLGAMFGLTKPVARVHFEARDHSRPTLRDVLWSKLRKVKKS
jgi:predicted GTPase